MNKKTLKTKTGVVVSDKMDKTVVVSIERIKEHPIYKKKFKVSQKYKAHDENNEYKAGDVVEIASVRPLSRSKSYTVVGKQVK